MEEIEIERKEQEEEQEEEEKRIIVKIKQIEQQKEQQKEEEIEIEKKEQQIEIKDKEQKEERIILLINYNWNKKLIKLQNKQYYLQYLLAYSSTLGGAYSICKKPYQAYYLAKQQEIIGNILLSINIIIKAKLYQYINLILLGYYKKSQKLYKNILKLVINNGNKELIEFCYTIYNWIQIRSLDHNGNFEMKNIPSL